MLTKWYYFTHFFKTSNADEVTGGKDICNLTMVLARHLPNWTMLVQSSTHRSKTHEGLASVSTFITNTALGRAVPPMLSYTWKSWTRQCPELMQHLSSRLKRKTNGTKDPHSSLPPCPSVPTVPFWPVTCCSGNWWNTTSLKAQQRRTWKKRFPLSAEISC